MVNIDPGTERSGPGPQVDPQGQDAALEARFGVAEHGEVHVVGLGLLLEPLAIGPFDRGEPPGADGVRPGPEPFDQGLGVNSSLMGPIVPAAMRDDRRCPAVQ